MKKRLYLIGKKIFNNNWCPLLLCLLNGFSLALIETAIFIRMYQLFILNTLMLIYWHLIKDDKSEFKFKNDLFVLYVMVIVGFLTHYYYAFLAVVLYIVYSIKFIKEKNYKNLWKYTATIAGAALTAILIFPYCIEHIFFGYRGVGVRNNIFDLFTPIFWIRIKLYLNVLNSDILNGNLWIIIAIIIVLFIIQIIRGKKRKDVEENKNLKYIIIPLIVYFFISICFD